MTDRNEQIKHLRHVIETRRFAPTVLAEHALALMRLGESVFIVHDTAGTKSLAYARGVAADGNSYTLAFTRVRELAASEVVALEQVGVGSFVPPRPPPRLEASNVQD